MPPVKGTTGLTHTHLVHQQYGVLPGFERRKENRLGGWGKLGTMSGISQMELAVS